MAPLGERPEPSAAPSEVGRPGPSARIISRSFVLIFLGFFLAVVSVNLFALVPYYLERRGASELLYGAAAGMLGLGALGAMLLFAGRADRGSRRSAVLGYLAVAGVGHLVALGAMGQHAAWYLLVCALEGVMVGAGLPVIFIWASELSAPERRTQVFAWLGIAGLIGDSAGPLLGESLLATRPDPSAPEAFAVVFVAAIVLWPLSVVCFSRARDTRARAASDPAAGVSSLLRAPAVRVALIATVTFGGALGVMMNLGKNFVASIGVALVSVLLAGHTLGALAVRLMLPWILERIDRVRLVPFAFGGVAFSMLLLSFARDYGGLALAGVVYGTSHGLLFPTFLSRLIDFGGEGAAGRVGTLYMGMFSLGLGLMPALGGAILPLVGFPVVFRLVGAGTVVGLVLTQVAERRYVGAGA